MLCLNLLDSLRSPHNIVFVVSSAPVNRYYHEVVRNLLDNLFILLLGLLPILLFFVLFFLSHRYPMFRLFEFCFRLLNLRQTRATISHFNHEFADGFLEGSPRLLGIGYLLSSRDFPFLLFVHFVDLVVRNSVGRSGLLSLRDFPFLLFVHFVDLVVRNSSGRRGLYHEEKINKESRLSFFPGCVAWRGRGVV